MISVPTMQGKHTSFYWRPAFTCPHHLFLITSLAPHVCYYVKSTAKNHCNCPDILWIWDTFWSIPPNSLFMVIRIQCRTVLKSVSNVTMSHLHQDYWHWRESQDDNDRLRLGMFWFAVWPGHATLSRLSQCQNVSELSPASAKKYFKTSRLLLEEYNNCCANVHWIR